MMQSILFFILILTALLVLFKKAKLVAILAFVATGMVVGPYGLKLFSGNPMWDFLGEVGIIFMWFLLGLELSTKRLWVMKDKVFGFGGMEVIFVTLLFAPLLYFLTDWNILAVIMIAMMLSMSSTATDVQILADRNQLQTNVGRQAFSVLLFQDLLAIPILAMLPVFAGKSVHLGAEIVDVIVMGFALIGAVYLVGHFILNPLTKFVSKTKSDEVMVMFILTNIAVWAGVFTQLGLPVAMGAFLAGMMFSETIYKHQIQSQISPYKMIMLGFFFIALGLSINMNLLTDYWVFILSAILGIIIIKFLAIYFIARIRKIAWRDALEIGVLLAQSGEFGLVLLQVILRNDLYIIPEIDSQILTIILVGSLTFTPILVGLFDMLKLSGKLFSPDTAKNINDEEIGKVDVVICGFGRVGQTLVKMFEKFKIKYIAIDNDVDSVLLGRENNLKVYYGDTTKLDVLQSLGLKGAKIVIVALDNSSVAKKTVRTIKELSKRVKIFVRARNVSEAIQFNDLGVYKAMPETIESSLVLAGEVLEYFGIKDSTMDKEILELRNNNYRGLTFDEVEFEKLYKNKKRIRTRKN